MLQFLEQLYYYDLNIIQLVEMSSDKLFERLKMDLAASNFLLFSFLKIPNQSQAWWHTPLVPHL